MEPFQYRADVLFAEDVSLADIAEQHGTPCYVYSRAALESGWRAYDDALSPHPHLVCYAVKANSNLALMSALARLGAGFDIVSQGELERVLAAGGQADRTVFSGVGKTRAEMASALQHGVLCFNVESDEELQVLGQVAASVGKVAPVSIRVNPDVDPKTHPYIATGLAENKFGIPIHRARGLYELASGSPYLEVVGVDCHIGSQQTTLAPFMEALQRLLALVDDLAVAGHRVKHLNLGGGMGICYQDEEPPTPAEYAAAIGDQVAARGLTLLVEPGRSVVGNAGVLLTRVIYRKDNGERRFAVVDAAMNDLLRPALYSAWQRIGEVQRTQGVATTYDVVGPVCESADFLGKERSLALVGDDLLAVHSAGAYGFVMSSNYNTRPRGAEIVVDGEAVHVARRRETIADLLALESVLPAAG